MNKQLDSRLARKWAGKMFTKEADGSRLGLTPWHQLTMQCKNAARIMAPSFFVLVFAVAAHAQGTIDFTPVQTVGTSIITILKYIGGAMAVGGLIFSAFEWFGRHDAGKAIGGVVGAIVGAVVIGAATAWGASTTGQTVQ